MRLFDLLSADVKGTEILNLDYTIRGSSQYPTLPCKFTVKAEARNAPWNKQPHSLTVRRYAALLIDLNEYLESFPGATLTDKIGLNKLNEILPNSMPTRCYKHAYVQGFDCEYITFKKYVNMFECMEISEYIYEGVGNLLIKTYLGRRQPFWSEQAKERRTCLVMDSHQEGRERWQAQKRHVYRLTGK